MPEPKSQRVNLRVTTGDSELFRRAALIADESLTEFVVASARVRAQLMLAGRTRFILDDASWEAFVAALDRPAQVNQRLVDLFNRPRPA
jgi:uncharacterized protein (DUF1778 family)